MNELPDLDRLSAAEKDGLIRALFAQVQTLTKQVEMMTTQLAKLEGRLAKNSRNSSKPQPCGGQKGHPGHTLKPTGTPDHIEVHAPPEHCDACGTPLPQIVVVEARQVFDFPSLRHEVTEHQVLKAVCTCGKAHRGAFPAGVSAPVRYGSRLNAAVVHLTHHPMMPVSRTGDWMGDLFGLPLSDATLLTINAQARSLLAPTVTAMGQALKTTPVVHADETGMKVGGTLLWLHVLATTVMTTMGCHANRGRAAFDAFGILNDFVGTRVHDGWRPYRVAEQAVRMPKFKQKFSGIFRTTEGLESFCIIRSYLATRHKRGAHIVQSLTQAFQGSVPQPRFA